MLIDFNKLERPPEDQYDVCVIGAGAAGITIALKLAQKGKRVALCEAGDFDYSHDSQDIYTGKVFGDPYFDLASARLRFFGGSTNHWGGWSRSFEPNDFERDDMGEKYRWPIEFQDVNAYLIEACKILEVDSNFSEEIVDAEHGIKRIEFKHSKPVHFLDKYADEIIESGDIDLFINANFYDFSGADRRVQSAHFKNYQDVSFKLNADAFVFAMGGIENSRQLLWVEQRHRGEFFEENLPIGRYWMEHPHFTLGEALLNEDVTTERYYSITSEIQKKFGVLGCGFVIQKQGDSATKRLVKDLLCVAPSIGEWAAGLAGKNLICAYRFLAAWEQAPDFENRVALSLTDQDRFGVPLTELFWKKGSIDRKTMEVSADQFSQWIMNRDLGRVRLDDWVYKKGEYPLDGELAGYHHMGGTRMSHSGKFGVVDANCKIFGSDNIFVAGSSLYTTAGYNNPTLALLQLSLRLADHLG